MNTNNEQQSWEVEDRKQTIAYQHRVLVHADGSKCLDGCDRGVDWCQCASKSDAGFRRAGWIVCGHCNRAVGG